MSMNHGINTYKSDTEYSAVIGVAVGIPFVIGAWPCHAGKGYTGKPQLVTSFSEAKELGGFSKAWRDANKAPKWNLCQAIYSQFKLFGVGPAVVMNLFDPKTHKTAVRCSGHLSGKPADRRWQLNI